MLKITTDISPRTGAHLSRFRQRYGLTVAKMCALFGISTQSKYNEIVRADESGSGASQTLDTTVALILRLYETHENLIPLNNEFSLNDCHEMFQRVFGKELITESIFGILLGRSAGTGYRWLSGSGNATPQVGIVLERMFFMLSKGMSEREVCMLWLQVVQADHVARGLKPPLADIDPYAELVNLYPLKYKNLRKVG